MTSRVHSRRTELNSTELTCIKLTQLHVALLVMRVSVMKLIGCTAAGLQCKYFVSVRRTTNRSLGGRTRQVQVVGLDVWIKHQTSQFSACSPGCATAASERFSVPHPNQLHSVK